METRSWRLFHTRTEERSCALFGGVAACLDRPTLQKCSRFTSCPPATTGVFVCISVVMWLCDSVAVLAHLNGLPSFSTPGKATMPLRIRGVRWLGQGNRVQVGIRFYGW